MKWALVVVLAGCAGAQPAAKAPTAAPDVTTYYLGHGDVLGMDGTVYVHDAPSLVERTVSPGTRTILETVYVERAHGMVTTTLHQTDADPQVFTATDEHASFSGTLTYKGDPWHPQGWSYDITLANGGGTITGKAWIFSDEIHAEKLFTDGGGTPRARIKDVVRETTREAFLAKRKEVTGS